MTPVEIMARSMEQDKFANIEPPLYDVLALTAVRALEAAGWRIAHPEKVTEEMLDALCAEYRDDDCEKLSPLRKAIAAAPLHGKG